MSVSYSDLLITLAIICVVLYAAHRLGQINPVGTGRLSRRLNALETKVGAQGEKLEVLDEALQAVVASSQEAAIEIGAMRAEMGGDREVSQRTWAAISRIEGFFIEDSFKGRRSGQ